MKCRNISGIQANNKNELKHILKACKQTKKYKIVTVSKPVWWYSKWKKLYEIRRK